MSLFFDYFKNTLKWLFIQSPGPIAALVAGGALALDSARDAILWLRLQASPETCDDEYLEVHARGRGIRQQLIGETIEDFRIRVIQAYAWQLMGGKNTGLPQILEHYGYPDTSMYNMRQEDTERWAEFKARIPADDFTVTEQDFKNVVEIVNDMKPARSKLAAVDMTTKEDLELGIAIVPVVKVAFTVRPYQPKITIADTQLGIGIGMAIKIKGTIFSN